MINVYRNSKIYIVSRPNFTTGGPELLQQLCCRLTQLGFNSYMYYEGEFESEDPVPEKYKKYNNRYVTTIEDTPNNILVFPEGLEQTALATNRIRKVMWWLGINHYMIFSENLKHPYLRMVKHYLYSFLGIHKTYRIGSLKNQDITYLAQCNYLLSFLKDKGVTDVEILSDYISEDFKEEYYAGLPSGNDRKNVVLYNPNRNTEFIKKIQEAAPHLDFIALQGMNPTQLRTTIKHAKVYVDFGSHPGKDRLPRECALLGCCILTSKIGSAAFHEDVPIPDECKFDRNDNNIELIIKKIEEIFSNYEFENKKFIGYQKYILKEKDKFDEDVSRIFTLT